MRLLSWNVNGIRAALKNGLLEFMAQEVPDVLCLQETKALPEQVTLDLKGYHAYWNSAERKGYSGTAVFSRREPVAVTYGMGEAQHDREGRIITLDLEDFFLVNVYTPNAGQGLVRLAYRMEWDRAFLAYLSTPERTKPVIFCGDLNVAHTEIDLNKPKANERNAGFTLEERQGFEGYLTQGYIDTFREFNKDPGHYTWWSYRFHARAKDIGWRIDYFCLSPVLRDRLQDAFILKQVQGSDHCPVGIRLSDTA